MKILGRIVWTAVGVAVFAGPVFAEDVVVIFKTDGPGGAGTSTQYYSKEWMRTNEGQKDTVLEYGTGTITNIDHKKKEYSQITLAEIEEAMAAMNAQMEAARAQMEAMPAAMRERMAKMMGGFGGDVTLTKGGTRQVAGYETQEYTVTMGEGLTMRLWNTTEIALPVPPAELKELASFTGPMAAMANNPMFEGFGQLAEKMKEIEGLTLAEETSTNMMGRGSQSSREAKEVRVGPISSSEFDVGTLANGYKKVKSPLGELGKW